MAPTRAGPSSGKAGTWEPKGHLPVDPSLPEPAARLLHHLLVGDRRASAQLLGQELEARSIQEVARQIIEPAMVEIGRLWAERVLTVADEHLATATLQTVATSLHASRLTEADVPADRRALFACVPGNEHDVGIQLLADAMEDEGWEVRNLGADVPIDDLAAMTRTWAPDIVGLSVSMEPHLPVAAEAIETLREALPEGSRILLGGQPVRAEPTLVDDLGADGGPEAIDLEGGAA